MGVLANSMRFSVLQVLAGMFLEAIGRVIWFAQVWNVLINMSFHLLAQVIKSVEQVQICYNFRGSRKCTLKTKYDMLFKRERLQSL